MNATDDWMPHPRFEGVRMKTLITREMNPGLTMHRILLAPGGVIPAHTHEASTETFYILRGRGACRIGAEEFALEPGSSNYAPPGIVHSVCNTGDQELEVLAIFNPPL